MIGRLFPMLAFAGPFRGSGIGVCRTFLWVAIGVCRTFFVRRMPADGFTKPKTGTRFSAYKAFIFTKRLFSKEGSGLRPACLKFICCDEGADCRSSPHASNNSKKKAGRSGGEGRDGGGLGRGAPPVGRRAVASQGGRQQGMGARSATVDSAWESREGAMLRGAERRGLRRDRRASDTLAFVPHDRRGYHPPVAASYRRPATPCPHDAGPAA